MPFDVQKTPTIKAPQMLTSSATLASTVDVLDGSLTRSSKRSQLWESGAKMTVYASSATLLDALSRKNATHTVESQTRRPNPDMSLLCALLDTRRMRLVTPHARPERSFLDYVLGYHVANDEERARGDHPCFQWMGAEEDVV